MIFRNLFCTKTMTTTITMTISGGTFGLELNPSESDLFWATPKSNTELFKSNPKNVLNLVGCKSDENKSDSMRFNLFQSDSIRLNSVQSFSIQNTNPIKFESFQPQLIRIHRESFGLNRLSNKFSIDLQQTKFKTFFGLIRIDSEFY